MLARIHLYSYSIRSGSTFHRLLGVKSCALFCSNLIGVIEYTPITYRSRSTIISEAVESWKLLGISSMFHYNIFHYYLVYL